MPKKRTTRDILNDLYKKVHDFRAPKNVEETATPTTPQVLAQDLTDDQLIQNGRLFTALILQASQASGITDLGEIQFNFCLQNKDGKPLLTPASKEVIRNCIHAYLVHGAPDSELSAADITRMTTNLGTIYKNLPPNPLSPHDYANTLQLRAESFNSAATLVLTNSKELLVPLNESLLVDVYAKFQSGLKTASSPESQQAHYDAYMQALTKELSRATGMTEKDVTKNLKEVETIINIKGHKTQVTLSGVVSANKGGPLISDHISVQMDQPLNRFSDFSKAQQTEWKLVYAKYQEKGEQAEYPKWFAKRTEIEKKIWLAKMKDVMSGNENANMGPVVKKQGFPGLRNLLLSSFATVKVKADGTAEVKEVSAKSVRSSNLISQAKDGNRTLNKNQKELTDQNIEQVSEIYQKNNLTNKAGGFAYNTENRKPFVLCQTLVRKIGGGDDHVIKHKNAAVKRVNEKAGDNKVFGSNHCIGTPAKVSKAFHLAMHLAGANTIGMDHIIAPVKDFMENAVMNNISNETAKTGLRELYENALAGKLTGKPSQQFEKYDIPSSLFNAEQIKTLDRVLQAANMYTKESGKFSSFKKNHQLHMAALENIIYEDTGNCVQSSCKSGKDREGVLKNYRNAMRSFYEIYGCLPPSTSKPEPFEGARARFVEIFVELFKTHHQARLAENNAAGCQGQKALSNILPKDIMKELKKDPEGRELLAAHKRNSALNDIGHSAVKADPAVKEQLASNSIDVQNEQQSIKP